ncbi:hypothetical protein ElyMa_003094500 [Elysia marginata]|uniref:SMB domain-containing protein n=1 Tax=Elysia marginata TaxID=1093978 RepID=A0AAV4ITE8_9GAST|nr:hypothetical protein ElyMa_003094500 [Elysia marginata]
MEGKTFVLLVAALVASTLLADCMSAPTSAAASDPLAGAPTAHPGEASCRNSVIGACSVCSTDARPNCYARVIRFCDCMFNCQGNDCDCSDNNVCSPLSDQA